MENENNGTATELHRNTVNDVLEAQKPSPAALAADLTAPVTKRSAPKSLSITETVMVALLVSAISLICYDHFFAPKFIVADLEGLSMNLSRAVAEKYITQEQGLARIDQAKAAVEEAGNRNPVLLASIILGDKTRYKSIELPFVALPAELKIPETSGAATTRGTALAGAGAKRP